jgi:uncharacterized protein YfaS (alpha-2-macroglobulin family)
MMLKGILLTTVTLLCCHIFYGQSGFPYVKEWKLIDSLTNKKNLPKSALAEVNKVYAAAKKEKNEAQWVKAIIYKNRLEGVDDNQNVFLTVRDLESEISFAPPRVAALLMSIEAEELYQYLQGNRYKLDNQTAIGEDTSTDMATWNISHLSQKIRSLYLSSLENTVLLMQTQVGTFDPVLVKGNTRQLRPTLYDLLAWRALEYFRNDDVLSTNVAVDSLRENPIVFSEARYFMHAGFSEMDSSSNIFNAIKIYQKLLRFHAKDAQLDAWIDADINRIQFVRQFATMMDKDSLYMNAFGRITDQYPTLSVSARAWFLQAQWWADQARSYDPLKDTLHRFDYLKAIAICEQAIKNPDSSEGKSNCEELIKNIKRKSFNLKIEQVNIPSLPFRALVTYKNIKHLYGRIIRIDDATRESFDLGNHDVKFWSKLVHMPYEKRFHQGIPETRDYQQHRVEIKIDALTAGQYVLLTSTDSLFSDSAVIGLTTFFCSSIAFVENGPDYFVVDRDSGHPLQNITIKTFYKFYENGKLKTVPAKAYQTDLNGYFHLIENQKRVEYILEFYFGKDYLSTSEYLNFYRDDERTGIKLRDNIFTDRSIYRPGQMVYFKGLLIARDFKAKKYKVAPQQKTTIFLMDVNDQKMDSLTLKSNDFGSINGIFRLPQNLLNGEFNLRDGVTNDEQSFSVEEYKRPSFYVDYDPVKESYRIGDSIKLSGSAVAYAGSPLDGSELNWRVYRETRFSYPWLFMNFPAISEKEMAHGVSMTGADGKFSFYFVALPDKFVNKATAPVYFYRVEGTITDGSGESRSATTSVAASYHRFEIVSSLPFQSRIKKDNLYQIPVTTKNPSGVFIKEELNVAIYALEGPDRLIRKRYWEQPDEYVMSEQEYVREFPNDEYKDESELKSWREGSRIFEKTDSTSEEGIFYVDKKILTTVKPGWYLIEFRSTDHGTEIVDKRYVDVSVNSGKPAAIIYNLIPEEELSVEPGSSLNIETGSAAKDLFVIRAKQGLADNVLIYSYFNLSQEIKLSGYKITESDRGGFAVNDVFVKNNRRYMSEHNILVPWTNKELQISYQTWKDKTLPGGNEQWKINISGKGKNVVMADVLTSMYDASLDQFKEHSWSMPDLYPVYNFYHQNAGRGYSSFDENNSIVRPVFKMPSFAGGYSYDEIIDLDQGSIRYRRSNKYAFNAATQESNMISYTTDGEMYMGKKKIVMAKFTAPEIVKDEAGVETMPNEAVQNRNGDAVHIRRNFNETAFFQPDLKTDAGGNIEVSFTMPEALTQWKWMVLAYTKDLSFGYSEKMVVTQKELMLQTNMPRFFREGDSMMLPVKIANLSSQNMTGTVQLEWLDPNSNQAEDRILGNLSSSQPFAVNASQSSVVFFPAVIPAHFNQPLLYRIVAKTNMKGTDFSDGEEAIMPVLSNRMLVTESLPFNMNGTTEKHFEFGKLLKSNNSNSLQNQSLTVEYTTNPVWYAVQSLPYLMEFPYECAEQTFNRFYANVLAAHIVQVSPALQSVFEKWKDSDTAALLNNLQKNEEFKSALLRETPWVLEAQSETQQKKNIALLFDILKMRAALKSAFDKLQPMQSGGGGFPWFNGGRDDRYITQYIISGIGRLRKLKAVPADLQASLNIMSKAAIAWLDKEINTDYERRDKSPSAQNLESVQVQYLYMRSFFPDMDVPGNIFSALSYYRKQAISNWAKQSVYMRGMIALFLFRTGDIKTANDILASLKENATHSVELGMYWKTVTNGYYWQQAPVETQSLLIEVFEELHAEQSFIDEMKYWLLQQKRTSRWPTTKATADACYALLLNGSDWLSSKQNVTITLGTYIMNSQDKKTEAGTGYFKERIPGEQLRPDMGNILITLHQKSDSIDNRPLPTVKRQPRAVSPSWGAIYWQYFENLDKITSAQTQLSISKNLFIEKNSDTGPVMEAVSELNSLKPGDKLKMRIVIKTDRDLEYVHLKDMRAACLEPVNVLSGYQWQGGLGYYETTQDASTSFFFDRLARGTYVFEYPVFVTTAGNYSNGISSLECMYAPEFAAHSEGARIRVVSK